MNLIEAFEKNSIIGLDTSSPDKVIETIISKIFFYGDKVLKVYKYEKFFFGDFGFAEFRNNFYKEDFGWNKKMAPGVYLSLAGVKKDGEKYKLAELAEAEDFFIEMKKFDDDKNLTNLLAKKQIVKEDIEKIVSEMIYRLGELTQEKRAAKEYNFDKKLIDIHMAGLESDRNLLYLITDFIQKDKTDAIIDFLKNVSINHAYFKDYNPGKFSLLIDNHADNIIFLGDKVQFIDVLPPKESWRVGDFYFVASRLATDIAVRLSEGKSKIVYEKCKDVFSVIPEDVKNIYEIRSALIQMWCFSTTGKPEIAQKYFDFIDRKVSALSS